MIRNVRIEGMETIHHHDETTGKVMSLDVQKGGLVIFVMAGGVISETTDHDTGEKMGTG